MLGTRAWLVLPSLRYIEVQRDVPMRSRHPEAERDVRGAPCGLMYYYNLSAAPI
jgi:hypothetical protein